jgi:hypothetical protein
MKTKTTKKRAKKTVTKDRFQGIPNAIKRLILAEESYLRFRGWKRVTTYDIDSGWVSPNTNKDIYGRSSAVRIAKSKIDEEYL